ncbi:MAG: ParM/StbA family protein [Bacillota bacterium]|nr:ParM/StbA family protein [Bacillota bacterium]
MTQIIGIDGGNSTIITALEGKEPLIIPTILAPYRNYDQGLEMMDMNKKSLKDSLDVEIILNYNDVITRKELGRFYVGNLAKEMEGVNVKERAIGKVKAGDEILLICMLSSLAVAVCEANETSQGEISQEIKIVTGLPFLQYKSGKEEFIKQFSGHHKIIIKGNYNIEVVLDITDVNVEIEGVGALNKTLLNNSDHMFKDEELIDRTVLGIEIGEFTSDIIALTFKEDDYGKIFPEYKQKLCMGIDMGIAGAKQPVIDLLREKYNTIVDRFDIDSVLKRKLRKGEIDLEAGETFNIIGLFEENLLQLSNTISTLINNKVKSCSEKGKIKYVLLYGGGVCVLDCKMGKFLNEKIQEVIGGKCIVIEKANVVNALGYLEKAKILYGDVKEQHVI